MTKPEEKVPPLSASAVDVFAFLRNEALKRLDTPLPDPYGLPDYELTKLLILEAGDAMLVNPMNFSSSRYDKRLYPLWNALRARLDGQEPPLLPGDEVVVDEVRGQIGEYRELTKGGRYFVKEIFYKYEINNPYDPVWTVYVSKDKEGKHSPLGNAWAQYDAGFFKKVVERVAAA
jgi:hypothetical protein